MFIKINVARNNKIYVIFRPESGAAWIRLFQNYWYHNWLKKRKYFIQRKGGWSIVFRVQFSGPCNRKMVALHTDTLPVSEIFNIVRILRYELIYASRIESQRLLNLHSTTIYRITISCQNVMIRCLMLHLQIIWIYSRFSL